MKRSRAPSQVAKRTKTAAKATVKAPFRIPRAVGPTRTGFPKQLKILQRYVDNTRIVTGLGALGTFQFSCNGLFDPNITGVGHQPMYFDQLGAIYNHYTVLQSKITIQVVNTSAETAIVGVYIEDDTTLTPASSTAMCEQPSAAYRQLNSNLGSNIVTISKTWSATQAFGPGTMANDNLQGTIAANPTEQQYFTLFLQDIQTAAVVSANFLVTLEYVAVWDELKNLISS